MANKDTWIAKYRKDMRKYQNKYIMDYSYRDIYDYYKERFGNKLKYKEFKALCVDFNKLLSNAIITESLEFKMPYRLGSLRIRAKKQRIILRDGKADIQKMAVDWPSSRKMWQEQWPNLSMKEILEIPHKKVLVYTNDHSNGYIMRWYWDKRLAYTKNQNVYVFKTVKGEQDSEYYKQNPEDIIYYGRRGLAAWIKSDERTNEYFG